MKMLVLIRMVGTVIVVIGKVVVMIVLVVFCLFLYLPANIVVKVIV